MQMTRALTLSTSLTAGLCAAPVAPAVPPIPPAPAVPAPLCMPAQGVIGKQGTPSVIEKARVASGAAMARLLHPRQVVTLEFNAERLNLVVDGKGRITAVRCG